MMSRFSCRFHIPFVFPVLLSLSLVALATAREWSDTTGNFKVNGEVVSYDGKVVRLALEQGPTVNIPVEKLSGEDRAYLKKTYPDGKLAAKSSPDGKKSAPKPEVVGLAIVKSVANQTSEEGSLFSPGTHVRLLFSDPELSIVGLDAQKSKIASFTDNKNTDLLEGGAPEPFTFEASSDEKGGLVTIHVPNVPAQKSVRLTIKGEVHLVCGLGADADTVRVPLNLELTLGL